MFKRSSFATLGFVLLCGSLLQASAQAAGSGTSGGGSAVVCRDPQSGAILSPPYLYDLYEAEHDPLRAYHIDRTDVPVETQLDQLLDPSKAKIFGEDMSIVTLRHALYLVDQDWKPTDGQTSLNRVPDFIPQFLPKDPRCKIEVVANYDDQAEALEVDSEIYGKMGATDQAALKLHEATYKIYRILAHDTQSDRAREYIGSLFGTASLGLYADFYFFQDPAEYKIDFSNVELVRLTFGPNAMVCNNAAGKPILTFDASGTNANSDNPLVPWYAQEFDTALQTLPHSPKLVMPPTVEFDAENDEYGSSLSFLLSDLFKALAPESSGLAVIPATYSIDKDARDGFTDIKPVQKFSCKFQLKTSITWAKN